MSRFTPTRGDLALRRWMRGVRSITLRVTAISITLTAIVAALLMLANQILQNNRELTVNLVGVRIGVGQLVDGRFALPALLAVVGAWVLLSSMSRLVVARQVRGHLMRLTTPSETRPGATRRRADGDRADGDSADGDRADGDRADGDALGMDDEPGEGSSLMAERLLLESYLTGVSYVARALAFTVILAVLTTPLEYVGLVAVWAVTLGISWHRYRLGQGSRAELVAATERARTGGAAARQDVVEAIYRRDAVVMRLTVPQASVVLASALLLLLVPIWVRGEGEGVAPALVIVLLLLQAMMVVATEGAVIGWRQAAWWQLRSGRDAGQERTYARRESAPGVISLVHEVPATWPASDVVWLRADPAWRTLVVFAAAGAGLGGVDPRRVAAFLLTKETDLLVLTSVKQPDGSAGYSGLGVDLPTSLTALGRLLDLTRCSVVGIGPGVKAAAALRAQGAVIRATMLYEADALARLHAAGATARMLKEWFTPDLPTIAVAETGTAEATRAAVEVRRLRPGADTVLAFSAIRQPGVSPQREFGAPLARFDVTVIFVKDMSNTGFLSGVPPLATTMEDAVSSLKELIEPGSRIAGTVGASIGSIGAVVSGVLLDVPRIVLLAPRTLVTEEDVARRRARDPEMGAVDVTQPAADLRTFLLERPHPLIDVHVGELNGLDMQHADRLAGIAGVRIILHPTDRHGLAAWLHSEGQLASILGEALQLPSRATATIADADADAHA